ncbi:MAG: hypothetical protein GY715_09895 [Planctomycetes bacterium]|nr:hypothetical protein [Planctomycetota bacterium]
MNQRHDLVERASILLIVLVGATAAHAQTNMSMIIFPWEEGEVVEIESEFLFQDSADVEGSLNLDADLQWYAAEGRWRLDSAMDFGPTLGFETEYLKFSSTSPLIPERLVDTSIAFGSGITETEWGGILMTVGLGFAGDSPFNDSDAVYAEANLIAVIKESEDEGWQIAINYNGNRTLWPDIPIPTVNYYKKVSDELFFSIGTAYNIVRWTPNETFRLTAVHKSPFTIDLTAEFEIVPNFWLQAGFHNRFNAYHLDGDVDDRRVFFTHRRLEAGMHWTPSPNFDLVVAGGWAFDQELERGWDSRDLNTVVELDDAPYLRIALEAVF